MPQDIGRLFNTSYHLHYDDSSDEYQTTPVRKADSSLVNTFGALHYVVAVAVLSLLLFILYIIYQQVRLSRDPPPAIPSCDHRLCIRITDPSIGGCILDRIQSERTNSQRINISTFTNPLVTNEVGNMSNHLDLPPSYFNSIRGESYRNEFPPSYDEAIRASPFVCNR